MLTKEELIAKAKALGITHDEDIEEDDLNTLIEEKENPKSKDPAYLEAELQKVIRKRDEAKADKRKLKEKLDALEKDLKEARENAADPEEIKKVKDELKELKNFKKEMDDKAEEEELKNKTEKERLEVSFNKELKNFKAQLEELKVERDKVLEDREEELKKAKALNESLRRYTLESDILKYAAKNDALKPEQIVKLTRNEFTWDDKEETFIYLKKDKKGKLIDELTVGEFISEYLSDEENENLVRGSVKSGFKTEKKKDGKSSNNNSLDITDQIKKEAESRDLDPEVWAKIKSKQDEKLGRNKKKV